MRAFRAFRLMIGENMNDTELLKQALEELENLVNLAKHAMTEQYVYPELDVMAELESPRHVISLLRARLADVQRCDMGLVRVIDARGDMPQVLRPVAKVAVQIRGGNPGIAWHAAPLESYESLPPMPDGAILYA
jgi:hypothetical protein